VVIIRPILISCVGYIIGIIWGLYFKISIALLFVIGLLVLLILRQFVINKNRKIVLKIGKYFKILFKTSCIIIFIASALIGNMYVKFLSNKAEKVYAFNSQSIGIKGTVVSNVEEKEYTYMYKIKVESINEKSYFDTYLIMYSDTGEFEFGDYISVNGDFSKPAGRRNYGSFDYRMYLKSQKIYGIVTANKINLLEKNKTSFLSTFSNNIKISMTKKINDLLQGEEAALLEGILLGVRENISNETEVSFKNSGMTHLLAVSGSHINYIILRNELPIYQGVST
jgi:competence protein ComEC